MILFCHQCQRDRLPQGGVQMTPAKWLCQSCWIARSQNKERTVWPFPPATGPTPWTKKQIDQHAREQRDQLPDAPM